MAKVVLNAYERGLYLPSLAITGFAWCEKGDSNPLPSSNISDLVPKTMQTNADKALECRQNAYEFNR